MSLRVRRPNLPLRGIRVVEYPTEFPHRELLEQKLKGGGGDCARAAGGDDRGRVCRGVCGEGVVREVPELRLWGFV